jgi:hypothetical protein
VATATDKKTLRRGGPKLRNPPTPPPSPPVNSVLPALTGTAEVGQTLVTSNGTWTGSPTFTYQWQRNGVSIAGATAFNYLIVVADVGKDVTCVVRAFNSGGATLATSNALHVTSPVVVPANTVLPVITGFEVEGQTLSCSTGTWTETPSGYTYQWQRSNVDIGGATGATHLLVGADAGTTLTCIVTASNSAGAGTPAESLATGTIAALPGSVPVNSVAPAIVGVPTVGVLLSVTPGTWTNSPISYSYQWKRNGTNIGGATASTYTLVTADLTANITVAETATNAVGPSASATTSAAIGPVVAAPSAPASVVSPVVGTSRAAQWALRLPGATGPTAPYSNGKWNTTYPEVAVGSGVPNQPPNDPYLAGLGFLYNNYGDLWIPFTWIDPGGDRTITNYDFAGAPDLAFWGNGSNIIFTNCQNFNAKLGVDINRNPAGAAYLMGLQITYCNMNYTRWDLLCSCTFELGPYNRISNQAQELGFGGGYQQQFFIGINIHHNYITGGGCNPAPSAHIEWLQSICAVLGTGSYVYVEDNMVDVSIDGQQNPAILEGWTGFISCGGQRLKCNRNIWRGADIVQWIGQHPPGGLGTVVAYGDDNVTSPGGVEINDNCFSYNPNFGPSYKHGGGVLKPTQSGNRWFRDADSDAAGVPLVKADNVALTNADFG